MADRTIVLAWLFTRVITDLERRSCVWLTLYGMVMLRINTILQSVQTHHCCNHYCCWVTSYNILVFALPQALDCLTWTNTKYFKNPRGHYGRSTGLPETLGCGVSYSWRRAVNRSSLSSLSEPPQSSPTPGTRRSTAAACTQMRGTFVLDMQISARAKLAFSGRRCKVNKQLAKCLKCNWVLLYAWDGPGCLLHKKASGRRGNQWQRLERCRNVSPGTSHAQSEGRNPTAERKQLQSHWSLCRKRLRLNQAYMLRLFQNCPFSKSMMEAKLWRWRHSCCVQADKDAL